MPGRFQLNDYQRFLVALAVAAALFVIAMSVGMRSLNLLLVGVGTLVALVAGRLLLGLRRSPVRTVHGSAYVIMVRPPRAGVITDRCLMRLMVEVPGRPSTTTQISEASVPVSKWPRVGAILPVTVTANNQRQVRVRWDLIDTVSAPVRAQPVAVRAGAPAPAPARPDPVAAVAVPSHSPPLELDDFADVDDLLTDLDDLLSAADIDGRADRHYQAPAIAPAPEYPDAGPVAAEPEPAMGMMLAVTNLDRSLRFYRDRLGFDLADRSLGGAVLTHGYGRILLREVSDVSMMDRRAMHVHIQVEDLEARYLELRARGVDFVHSPQVLDRGDRFELHAATFRDPDGHVIALTQWRGTGTPSAQDHTTYV